MVWERFIEALGNESLTKFSERCGVSYHAFGWYKNGVEPRLYSAKLIASALSVSLDWLCGMDVAPTRFNALDLFGDLGERLKTLRMLNSLSVRKAARLMDVFPSRITNAEKGNNITVSSAKKYAELYGISLDALTRNWC